MNEDRMNAKDTIMSHLMTALRMELTAVSQYRLHSHVARDLGFDVMAAKMREEMEEESGHADMLIDRILFHGGEPNLTELDQVSRATSVKQMLESNLKDEKDAIAAYSAAAADCEKTGDYVSRDLFVSLIADEEGHAEWLDRQLGLMKQLGDGIYLQTQMGDGGASAE